jgi:hypothetical protein
VNTPESSGSSPESTETEATSTGIANIERAFLRLTFWQTLLSLAGVFTGAVALYAALNESQAVRQQTAASVWPYVQLMVSDSDDGETASFELSFENVGVGPARMRGMQITLDGDAVASWEAATAHLQDEPVQVGVDYGRHSVSRRVIAPGEPIIAFQTHDRRLALAMQEAVYSGRAGLRYCYCSIFDDCWQVQSLSGAEDASRQAVDACPDYGEASFRD